MSDVDEKKSGAEYGKVNGNVDVTVRECTDRVVRDVWLWGLMRLTLRARYSPPTLVLRAPGEQHRM